MNCLKPILLKSGELVPCGQCTLCQSKTRTEKSVLVQMHCEYYNRMPLFIGLSYNGDNLPYRHIVTGRYYRGYELPDLDPDERARLVPSLHRQDVSRFLKSYKRLMNLRNDVFTYFGCGEYGQDREYTNRPHYHLIWFGDAQLESLYDCDVHFAENWLANFWEFGNVDINVAEWSGIHYVTKYCLKDENRSPKYSVPAFTITGKGIGLNWLKSLDAERIKQRLLYLHFNRDLIYSHVDLMELDWSEDAAQARIDKLKEWRDYFRQIVPDFTVTLPSGNKAVLPRKLKQKLVGSYQHFADNPLWLYNFIVESLETEEYWRDYKDLDRDAEKTQSLQMREQHALSIIQRIKRNNAKKL